VHVANLKPRATVPVGRSTGILATSSATGPNVDTSWNLFLQCTSEGCSVGLELRSDAAGVNCFCNRFIGFNVRSHGTDPSDAGILLTSCDNNTFLDTWVQMDGGLGFGVVVADPVKAFSNYFYHLQPGGGFQIDSTAGAPVIFGKNFVFGYDQVNAEPAPTTDSANPPKMFLAWTDNFGNINGMVVIP
jgi:hypothetical protein